MNRYEEIHECFELQDLNWLGKIVILPFAFCLACILTMVDMIGAIFRFLFFKKEVNWHE